MAKGFNLTAQINLRGPTNLKPIVADIRRQLGSITSDVNIKLSPQSAKSVDAVTRKLTSMNAALVTAKNSTDSLNSALSSLSISLSSISSVGDKTATSVLKTAKSSGAAAKNIKEATTEMEAFGKQSALAIRRFAAFSVATSAIYGLINAINSGFKAFISFDKELIKLQQVTNKGATGIGLLEKTITNLSTTLGVSSESLISVASTLAQAGLTAEDTRIALKALAKTELAPSFDNLTDTTEGAIAALRQFELQAGELEGALGSINAVAAAFAVESKDIISAIQRTGGVFAAASKGVSEGTDALNEFVAIFTSVRQTTRESAETIATGLRTIFTRIQRARTIDQLKDFGITLTDLEGKFVGPYEAIKRLSEGLRGLDPRDLRFSQIVEELGGFRQIGKVIPLIQQFTVAQEALKVAQRGQDSLTEAQVIAQKSLANQIAKVREQFLALIRDVGKSSAFQGLFKLVTGLTSGLISLAGAFKPILPILAIMGTIKGIKAVGEFGTGFVGGLKKAGGARDVGSNIGETVSGAKEKEASDLKNKATNAISANTSAIKTLTTAMDKLTNAVNNRTGGGSTFNNGGKVMAFARGGVVPGSGKGDKIPALLEPGEVVINNKAASKYGRGNLVRMNKYARGGEANIFQKQIPGALKGMKDAKPISYNDISKLKINNSGKGSIRGYFFENFINKKFGVDAPDNKFPDIPNLNIKKGLKEKLGLTKSQTGRDFKAAELKYRSGIKPEFDKQYTPENTAILYAVNKNIGGKIQKFAGGGKALGARSKIKQLDDSELSQLSTKELIAYAKAQAYDIFSTSGAGIAIGSEFIEVPQERIIPELESSLVSYMGKRGFWREKVAPFGQQIQSKIKNNNKLNKQQALEAQVSKYSDEVAAREQNWTAIRSGSEIDNYLLSKLQEPILSDYKTARGGGSLSKQFHNTRLRKAVNEALENYDNFDYSPANIDKLVSGIAAKKFVSGGLIQKFNDGPAGTKGVQPITSSPIVQNILDSLSEVGGSRRARELLGLDKIKTRINSIKTTDKIKTPSASDVFDKRFLQSANAIPFLSTLSSLADEAVELYSGTTASDFKLTQEQIAAARDVAITGFQSDMKDLGSYYRLRKGVPLHVHTGIITPDKYPIIEELLEEQHMAQVRAAQKFAPNASITPLTKEERPKFGEANLGGYNLEAILALLGSGNGKKTTQDAIDFASGLTPLAAGVFGVPPNIPTQAKLTVSSSNVTKALDGMIKAFAFGGKADGPNFEEVKKQIMDKYPEIDFRISKRKSGFGYMLQAGLSPGQRSQVNFASNLKDLSSVSDQMAQDILHNYGPKIDPSLLKKLQKNKRFAVGGQVSRLSNSVIKSLAQKLNVDIIENDDRTYDIFDSVYGKTMYSSLNMEKLQDILVSKYRINPEMLQLQTKALGGSIQQFASGGTVPAMVSAGEAFVPPKLAKKIGYSRLNKMNQADRNGMKGFAGGGGISVFKGPGSGTSDSIGPIGLPEGSFIIRQKATKALGLNKGGGVGSIQKFIRGGVAEQQTERAQGSLIQDVKQAEKTFAMLMGQLGKDIRSSIIKNFQGIEAVGAGKKTSLGTTFTESTRGQAAFGTKRGQDVSVMGLQIMGKKASATTETVAHEAGHLADYSLGGKKGFASSTEGTFQFKLIEKIKPVMEKAFIKAGEDSQKIANYLTKNEELFAEFFAKASPEVRAIITSTTDAQVGMKALADHLGDVGYTYAGLEASDIDQTRAKSKKPTTSSKVLGALSAAQTKVRSFFTPTSTPATPASPTPSGGPSNTNPFPIDLMPLTTQGKQANALQKAAEEAEFFAYKAKEAGQSVNQFSKTLATKVVNRSKDLEDNLKNKQTGLRYNILGKADDLKGVKDKDVLNAALQEFAAQIKEIDPSKSAQEIESSAKAIVKGLKNGLSLDNIIASSKDLEDVFKKTYKEGEALQEALKQVAKEAGMSADALKKGIGPDKLRREQFIQSDAGQSFGNLARLIPDKLEKLSKTGFGKGLSGLSNALSGKGLSEKLEKSFGRVGGAIGDKINALGGPMVILGASMSALGEKLPTLLGSKYANSETAAGVAGGIGGAGQGLASGALLGGQLAGPVGAMIGGISGAIIGGIKGAFEAFNQKRLENNLRALEKTSGDVAAALEKLTISASKENIALTKSALGADLASIENMGQQAQLGTGGPARGWLEFFRMEPTGLINSATGGNQEAEARQSVFAGGERALATASRLGDINRAGAPLQQIEDLLKRANTAGETAAAATGASEDTEEGKRIRQQARESARNAVLAQGSQTYQQLRMSGASADSIYETAGIEQARRQGRDVGKELQTQEGRDRLKEEGKRSLAIQEEAALKQELLADSMRNVIVQTDNLIDMYRRVQASLERFGQGIENIKNNALDTSNALRGRATVRNVNRQDEQVLGNISAYSMKEVEAVAERTSKIAGGGKGGTELANQIKASKLLTDELPRLLKGATGENISGENGVMKQLTAMFEKAKIEVPSGLLTNIEEELNKKLAGRTESSTGDLAEELDVVGLVSKGTAEAMKTAQAFLKQYNDALQAVTDLTREYGDALNEATEWQLKAADIRTRADIQLAETLGKNLSLSDLNKPQEQRILGLTAKRDQKGNIIEGGSLDPNAIYKGMRTAIDELGNDIEGTGLYGQRASLRDAMAANPRDADAKRAYAENEKAIASQTNTINNSRKALEELANDSSAASNALKLIEEQQKAAGASVNFLQKVLTSDASELDKMNKGLAAYTKLVSGKATKADVNSLQFRQQAFGGLQELQGLLPDSVFNQMQAKMSEAMIDAMPGGKEMLDRGTGALVRDDKTGGMREMTFREAIQKRAQGKDPEQERLVAIYNEAADKQKEAALRLAEAATNAANVVADAQTKVLSDVNKQIPTMIENAQIQSATIVTPPTQTPRTNQLVKSEKELDEAAKDKPKSNLGLENLDTTISNLTTAIGTLSGAIVGLGIAIAGYAASQALQGKDGLMGNLGRMMGFGGPAAGSFPGGTMGKQADKTRKPQTTASTPDTASSKTKSPKVIVGTPPSADAGAPKPKVKPSARPRGPRGRGLSGLVSTIVSLAPTAAALSLPFLSSNQAEAEDMTEPKANNNPANESNILAQSQTKPEVIKPNMVESKNNPKTESPTTNKTNYGEIITDAVLNNIPIVSTFKGLRTATDTLGVTDSKQKETRSASLDWTQFGLSLVGLVPVVGELADLANAGIYAARAGASKDPGVRNELLVDSALSAGSAVPLAGYAANAVKFGKGATKAAAQYGVGTAVSYGQSQLLNAGAEIINPTIKDNTAGSMINNEQITPSAPLPEVKPEIDNKKEQETIQNNDVSKNTSIAESCECKILTEILNELRKAKTATVSAVPTSSQPITTPIPAPPAPGTAPQTETAQTTPTQPMAPVLPQAPLPEVKPETETKTKKEPEFVKGEDAITRAEKDYAPTPERKAFVQNELKEARKRQRMGQKSESDDSVISASTFELRNIAKAEKTQKREAYLLKQNPRTRSRLMTKAEKEAGLEEKLAKQEAENKQSSYTSSKKEANPRAEQYLAGKKARREAYLSRFSPEVREKMMTKEERAERDSQVAKAEEAKKKAEAQAQEQQAIDNTQTKKTQQGTTAGSAYDQLTPEQKDVLNRAGALAQEQNTKIDELKRKKASGVQLTPQEENLLSLDREGQVASNNILRASPQPVSSNLPKPVEYNRQVQNTENRGSLDGGASSDQKAIGGMSTTITVDPSAQAFLEGLNTAFKGFDAYITRLESVASTIPSKIELTGNYQLQVQITGAAALEGLDKRMKELAVSLIEPKLEQLRNEVSSATQGAVKPSASLGKTKN